MIPRMHTFLVGGAVRDALLGLPPGDRDYVVVGETQAAMVSRGFKPVGRDFPVFLHPKTGEEYALARTERKSGRGYRGFVVDADPSVTLDEDLQRRDFTINAIAQAEDGTLVDPFGGARDLQARVLRHVGPAFAEDPLRVLRAARFMARFASLGFEVAPETMALMRAMVDSGELAELVPERVWNELVRALASPTPSAFLRTLRAEEGGGRRRSQRAHQLVPHAFGHEFGQFAGVHHRAHQRHRFRRDFEPERGEARHETRRTQHAQWIFRERGAHMAQHARLQVARTTEGI